MNLLLNDEYQYFLNKRKELNKLYLDAGQRAGIACQETETFHDNPEWEYARDDQGKYSKQISEIDNLLSGDIKIIKPEEIVIDGKVKIGTIIDLEINGEEQTYKIGGANISGFNDRVSYKAPLIKPLLGKEIDEELEITIAGILKEITILDVKGFNEN